jgi:hypothetical protein
LPRQQHHLCRIILRRPGCLDFLPTQVAFFVVAAAERADADFNHDDAIHALGQISTSNGNIVPLGVHRATDDDEIEGNHAPITTKTRDILLKALHHTQNTVESHIELQIKAGWPFQMDSSQCTPEPARG